MEHRRALLALVVLASLAYSSQADYLFYGCVRDGPGPRALPTLIEATDKMTVEYCRDKARMRGQAVFGVEYGRECYAGRNLTTAVTAYGNSSNCNMGCSGNMTQTCGGGYAMSLYYTRNITAELANLTARLNYTYQGCYIDDGGQRRMNQLWVDDFMTIDLCGRIAAAEGYILFGLQYYTECWASNDINFTTALGISNNCMTPCGGNNTQMCGGGLALSVYNTSAVNRLPVSPSPPPTPSPPAGGPPPGPPPVVPSPPPTVLVLPANVTSLGCYADTGARLIPVLLSASSQMTVAVCAQLAAAGRYEIFALQYTAECWASNDITRALSGGNSTACTMDCYQMPRGSCGGPLANSVYRWQPLPALPPSPSPPPSPPAPPPPRINSTLNITSIGCYTDRFAPDRAMTALDVGDTNMTINKCANLAYNRGYRYIGVQYGYECYAGVNITRVTRWGPATNCDSACRLDPPRTCGGGLANNIYQLPPLTANVTPAPDDGLPPPPPATPPPPSPPVPPGQLSSVNITFLGCYRDTYTRALPVLLRVSATMTIDECARLANSSRVIYTVIGVQFGQECYAGTNETKALQYGNATNCDSVCYDRVNNPVGYCGGGLANSVYRLPYRAPPPPQPPSPYNETYIGCFADGAPRALPIGLGADTTNMTVVNCAERARKGGYTIFSVQFGQECFAAESLTSARQYGPSDNCNTPCTGNPDSMCGGPNANQVYTIPPPPPPATVPSYTYLGCYADDQVFDAVQDPPMPMKRRMWRRLGQLPDMDNWECATRAKAAGYPYFGLTSGEIFPAYGKQCWGGFNLTHITGLGNSTNCTNRCHTWPGSELCGGMYAISLYRLLNVTYDAGAGGSYQYLLEMPVAGSHSMQVTGKDQFLLIDFIQGDHPPTWDKRNTTYMYFRGNNTYRAINNIRDASCGQWHRMPDGDMMGFSGYFGASGINFGSVWATMWYHRHQYDTEDFGDQALPYGRWYGGTMLMPDGRSYVTGGDLGPGTPRAQGSDIWDPAHKTWVGRYNNMGQNTPYLPLNQPLFDASTSGGYYPGLFVLPSGAYVFAQSKTVQVINPLTGAALAAAPPLPKPNYWEYPLSGSQVILRQPVLNPGQRYTFHFIVFGGGDVAAYFKPCTDFSMRIPIYVDCTSNCTHSMGDWEVETMLGHCCMLDTAVLPNGKVLLIGGVEEGLSNLEVTPNGNNGPVNEPWIYDPDKPAGQRYRRTGAYTRIARFYHGSHTMTSFGDIIASGSSVAKYFGSYHLADFDITPYETSEYRIEFFKPHYILGARPAWSFVPTMISYGETFTVGLAGNTSASSIAAVVLGDPGTTTHSSNMATRMQQLAFTVVDGSTLSVTAPANTFMATPTFYQLYLVARDDSYSVGEWIKLRGPWGTSVPLSLPRLAQFVANASTRGENTTSPWTVNTAGSRTATLASRSAPAAGSGGYGLLVTAGDTQPIVIAGPALSLAAGTRVHTFMWARAPVDNQVRIDFILLDSSAQETGAKHDSYGDFSAFLSLKYEQFPLGGRVPAAAGSYRPALRISGMTAGMTLHIDDIEVYTLTAADAAQSLQFARTGVQIQDQLGATRRKLLETPSGNRKVQRVLREDASGEHATDKIEQGMMNGWMGILATSTLRADKPELAKELKRRVDPYADWDPLGNLTIAPMTRSEKPKKPKRQWPVVQVGN